VINKKTWSKKIVIYLLVILLGVSLLASCRSSADQDSTADKQETNAKNEGEDNQADRNFS